MPGGNEVPVHVVGLPGVAGDGDISCDLIALRADSNRADYQRDGGGPGLFEGHMSQGAREITANTFLDCQRRNSESELGSETRAGESIQGNIQDLKRPGPVASG
ncbi:hypothetical protein B0H16DRAFT_1468567 [Mycena metata]|uniref:Uncharacterized protein n=1 Tax=Mycena metata TaxID=1033252 RepID=A0AAD7I234_9AGAR|nr:hypothetical protein B0H16DRAFT_1468567 [Mycena metata]